MPGRRTLRRREVGCEAEGRESKGCEEVAREHLLSLQRVEHAAEPDWTVSTSLANPTEAPWPWW